MLRGACLLLLGIQFTLFLTVQIHRAARTESSHTSKIPCTLIRNSRRKKVKKWTAGCTERSIRAKTVPGDWAIIVSEQRSTQ